MLDVALVVLLTAVHPTMPQRSAPTPLEPTGEPCTREQLIGTWQSSATPSTPGATTALKHVTPTHFFVVHLDEQKVVRLGHGGPYRLASGTYTETLEHGFGAAFEKFPGASVAFQCRVSGDTLHIVGEYQGHTMNEQWTRVRGASARP